MANAGFSAAEEIFGAITGLQAKESSDGMTGSVAEAQNQDGDTIAHDEYAQVMAPSVTYAVNGAVTSLPALGSIHTYKQNKIVVTSVVVSTQAGQPPTVTITGNQVHDSATEKRTYAITVNLQPRCKAQDVAGALTADEKFTQINTTYSADFVNATVGGEIVSACVTHGKIEVAATMTDGDGDGTITADSSGGFTITSPVAKNCPDEGYIELSATATKFLIGTESSAS